tara:strand:- start:1527 stop:1820 length:294 start_codon:yes stop_codon:yes gene_type:complete
MVYGFDILDTIETNTNWIKTHDKIVVPNHLKQSTLEEYWEFKFSDWVDNIYYHYEIDVDNHLTEKLLCEWFIENFEYCFLDDTFYQLFRQKSGTDDN